MKCLVFFLAIFGASLAAPPLGEEVPVQEQALDQEQILVDEESLQEVPVQAVETFEEYLPGEEDNQNYTPFAYYTLQVESWLNRLLCLDW